VSLPLVSCVLIVANAARMTLVRKAVNNFIRQQYTPYELIVVNGIGTNVLTNDNMDSEEIREAGCRVWEMHAPAGLNAAAMKNLGLEVASGDWVICIDDDDYFHPIRLMYQMAHRVDGKPCLLKYQLRIDISQALQLSADSAMWEQSVKPLLHLLKMDSGIPCTMLFPRLQSDGQPWLFNPDLNTGEYEELLARMQQSIQPVVCDNMHNPFVRGMQWPLLSIAVYHGSNELTYDQFFARLNPLTNSGGFPVGLNQEDVEYLKTVLYSYNFQVS